MATMGFRLSERFDSSWGDTWTRYVQVSGLSALEEVIGLDCSLCPCLIDELGEDDCRHTVYAEHLFGVFDDPDYLLGLCANRNRKSAQLLALAREPSEEDVERFQEKGFAFKGYELIEEPTCISALTNCRGFEKAFKGSELSACGLIPNHSRAYEVRRLLREHYPDELRADCNVWAIWRREDV